MRRRKLSNVIDNGCSVVDHGTLGFLRRNTDGCTASARTALFPASTVAVHIPEMSVTQIPSGIALIGAGRWTEARLENVVLRDDTTVSAETGRRIAALLTSATRVVTVGAFVNARLLGANKSKARTDEITAHGDDQRGNNQHILDSEHDSQ